jgi:8-oxoguanine deaminase
MILFLPWYSVRHSNVAYSIINGRVVVRNGECTSVETNALQEQHNRHALALAEAAR